MNIRSLVKPEINKPLSWTKQDFEKAKKWAQTTLHRGQKDKTVWEIIYSPRKDSVDILNEINQMIIIENKNK